MVKAYNVLTIATGKQLYVDMAVNLARSFKLWNDGSGIEFHLVTDLPQHLPEDVKAFIKIIQVQPGQFGAGFTPKLYLDKLAPKGQTIFIDSDCIIYGSILPMFKKFSGHAVAVIGSYIADGEWFGNIAAICKKFNVTKLPKFNGGVYYVENGYKAQKVYEMAREFEKQYDEIGFVRLRGRPNDEVVVALAMAMNDEQPIPDDGSMMSDPLSCPGRYTTDVIKGKTALFNPPKPSRLRQESYPFVHVYPVIVHFLGAETQSYQYKADEYRLEALAKNKAAGLTALSAFIKIELPMQLKTRLKNTLRPVFTRVLVTGVLSLQKGYSEEEFDFRDRYRLQI